MVSVDLGAQSGRVALGSFDGRRLEVSEVHRFPNVPVRVHDRLQWDALQLYAGVLDGMRAATRQSGTSVVSVAVDGWGVDFALLDRSGRLLQNPVHYRDRRTESAFREVCAQVPARQLFARTGIQLMPINTIYQLWSMVAGQDPVLDVAKDLLLMPDLFHYWLSGVARRELTEATTTQCYDPVAGDWAWDLLERLGLPSHLFGEIVAPGTILGDLRPEVAEDTGLTGAAVISPASHDTASAIAAVPFREPGSAYVSSGTWSVVGTEVTRPVIDDRSFSANLTNEGGPSGTFQLMSNATGLWLLHECQRTWEQHGHRWEFSELAALAGAAPPLASLVDPNAAAFVAPGDMPGRIADWCRRTGQEVPEGPGEMVRCLLESLTLVYRQTIELLTAVSGVSPPAVHIVGGGSRNELLCQWTADATGLPVWAGPTEASEVGNLLVQAMALGELGSLEDARAVAGESFSPVLYEPCQPGPWDEAYGRFKQLNQAGMVT
jgi:rhamnulokinase